jgi:ATP-dependent Clp protease, protease subunit
MSKEVLIYGLISGYSATAFMEAMANVDKEEELTVRINTAGGSVEYGWGIVAKISEHKGPKTIKVDGQAHSMGLFALCYADEVEALDVSEFLLHRAAYPQWYEDNAEFMTAEMRGNLQRINGSLQKAFEARVDVPMFEAMKGVKVKDIFSLDARREVFLTAQEAKKIGLVTKITKITPQKRAQISAAMEAYDSVYAVGVAAEQTPNSEPTKSHKMTLDQLKAQHPEVYAQAMAEGVAQERDRVEACLVFHDVDAAGVKAAIESGKPLSAKQMAEFNLKAANPAALKVIAEEGAGTPAATTDTPATTVEATAKEKEIADFEKEARGFLNIAK